MPQRCASMERETSGSRGNKQSYTMVGSPKGIGVDIKWVVG
jgi:hypothetical protein